MDTLWTILTKLSALLVIIAIISYKKYTKSNLFIETVNRLPGLKTYPIIGNILDFVKNRHRVMDFVLMDLPRIGPVVRLWIFHKVHIVIMSAKAAEPILKNSAFNNKSDNYKFIHPILGNGLITAKGSVWRPHRKVVTPAFHLEILQGFIPVFHKHAATLSKKLATLKSSEVLDILPLVALCSLDIICETTMGVEINVQENGNTEYVESLDRALHLVARRYCSPWLHPDILFYLSPTKRELYKTVKIMHDFNDMVIEERRKYLNSPHGNDVASHIQGAQISNKTIGAGGRRRLSLLDVLLTAEKDGIMGHKQIHDEVATFMNAGYETVSGSTNCTLFMIAKYPEVQSKVVKELDEVFGESGRCPDISDLANLKYLDRCIKETLRVYPTVILLERSIEQDVQAGNYLIPAGCTASFNIYSIHRDPEVWPEPDKFDPDRFLPENCDGRHPYAFIPFSAGPRNCIGQKFAMLEQKVIISTVLRRFRLEAAETREKLKIKTRFVLKTKNGFKIRLFDRESHPKLRVSSD